MLINTFKQIPSLQWQPIMWHHYQIMFTDHPKYCDAFQKVEDAKGKEGIKLQHLWGNKIKNQLVKYVTLYNKLW